MTDFKGRKISVIGAARSGVASAVVLKQLGAEVFLSEFKSKDSWAHREELNDIFSTLEKYNIPNEFGGHSVKIYDSQLLVTSPGVPANSEVLVGAQRKNINIISELELGFQLCRGKTIAITGSNGKTTTTALVGEIFSHSNLNYKVAGNIGTPFVSVAQSLGKDGWAILEVSTFQLEWIKKFKAKVAAVLNITPDHLDRHGSMERYTELKLSVFANQDSLDTAVLNSDDKILNTYTPKGQTLHFSVLSEQPNGCFIKEGTLILNIHGKRQAVIGIDDIGIKGPHNLSNACCATAICAAAGLDITTIAAGLRSFQGVEHRLEKVGLIGGVSFINDSKATNVDAVYWALQSVAPPIVLIAGGKDKAGDFSTLNKLVKQNVKAVILIGQAADKIGNAFDGITKLARAGSMPEAVSMAFDLAKPQGTVLLSPACASFDMFDNYEHRGRVFKDAVREIIKENR